MANVLLDITALTLPPGHCYPPTTQQLLIDFARHLKTIGPPGVMYFNYGDTAPDPEFQAYPWLRTVDDRWYNYSGGWISRHPDRDSNVRRLYVGSTVALQTYDGGDTDAPSDRTGPMWEVDTEFEGRFPIGAGTIAGTSPARTVGVAANIDSSGGTGDYLHTIIRAELPVERLHLFGDVTEGEPVAFPTSTDVIAKRLSVSSESQSYLMAKAEGYTDPTIGVTEQLGQGQSFVKAPRFRGLHFVKPTSRLYYRAT